MEITEQKEFQQWKKKDATPQNLSENVADRS